MKGTMISLLAGLVLVVAAAAHVNKDFGIFWDPVGLGLVVGGTAVVACVTFTPSKAWKLLRTSLLVLRQDTSGLAALAREVIVLARDTRSEIPALGARLDAIRYPFLKDGVGLIVDRLEIVDIENILRDRIRVKQENDDSTANMLKTLAKYPPSFGIIGTVLGLIALMLQLGQEGAAEKMGPAMALGLVATFYGLVLTNFLLQPLAESLAIKSHEDVRKRQLAMLGVLLIRAGKPALVVQEAINSLLPVSERVDELGLEGAAAPATSAEGGKRGAA